MNIQQRIKPLAGLLDLQEVKDHLRVEHGADDVLIQGLIDAAQRHVEGPGGVLGRTLLRQGWTGKLDRWPSCGRPIEIPLPPLISIDAVRYVAPDGTLTAWAPANYQVQMQGDQPAKLWPAHGISWPSIRCQPDGIEVDFTAGYGGPEALPESLRLAILQVIALWYDNRAGTDDVSKAAERLLMPFRVWYF